MLSKLMTCFLFVGAGLFLAHSSSAFTLPVYEGPFIMKMQNWDMGTLYQSPGIGVEVGGTGNDVVDAGLLDAITAVQATGALPSITMAGFDDDTWGIANVTELRSNLGVQQWFEGKSGEHLTVIFYSGVDTYFQETAPGEWIINAVGMRMDFWEDVGPVTPLDISAGSAGRTAADMYTTATDGTLILSVESVPGFLHQPGVYGGANAQFESQFNANNNSGTGSAYFQVIGGTMASIFDTNTIQNGNSVANGVLNADLWMQFTTTPTLISDWLVESDDPVRGFYLIPEPASLGMLGCGLITMLARRRRR